MPGFALEGSRAVLGFIAEIHGLNQQFAFSGIVQHRRIRWEFQADLLAHGVAPEIRFGLLEGPWLMVDVAEAELSLRTHC